MSLYDPEEFKAELLSAPQPSDSRAEQALKNAGRPKRSKEIREELNAALGVVLDPEHIINLIILARYLRSLPPDYKEFDLTSFHSGWTEPWEAYEYREKNVKCGSVACAVGHGPEAGVEAWVHESWLEYAYRAFGEGVFDAFFSAYWSGYDNTPRGAAARICAVLDRPAEMLSKLSLIAIDNRSAQLTTLYTAYLD